MLNWKMAAGVSLALVLTACLGAAAQPEAPTATLEIADAAPTAVPTQVAQVEEVPPTATTPPTEAVVEAAVEEAAPVVQASHPDRPSEPAGIDESFRSDPITVVAATGNPQLLEFFTYW